MKGYKLTLSGDYKGAARQFEKVRDVPAAMRDYTLYYLAKALHHQGRCPQAVQVFQELVENYPGSRWAPIAQVQVTAGAAEESTGDENPAWPVLGAGVRGTPEAPPLKRCPTLEQPSPFYEGEAPVDCDSQWNREEQADCYFNRRQYAKAKDLLKKLCETPSIPCLTRLSQAAARSQDFETAIRANKTLKERYPRSKVADEARRKIAFLHQDSGNYAAAIPLLRELVAGAARSGARDERRHYRERIAWSQFRLGALKEALKEFEDALEESETPFSLYWKARTLDKMGRSREANKVLREIAGIYGGTYYGLRAQERLGEKLPDGGYRGGESGFSPRFEPKHPALPVRGGWLKSTATFSPSEDLERIHELTQIGLVTDAEVEARRVRLLKGLRLPTDPKRLVKEKNGDFVVVGRIPKDEVVDYPLPYADTVFSETERRRESGFAGSRSGGSGGAGGPPAIIDPYLVYAMMRQESRYRETIVSRVGAVGLLQIMPATGLRLAKEDGWPEYQVKWLYDPETNIELGVQYLQKLWGLLDGRWYAVVASYNAGEHVVEEWLKQRKGLSEEEFIEEIPYRETRDYVKRVYGYWSAYRSAYED